ncbi:hypothetical protein SESBI_14288 [Sesbania bispinosa]|nr:hypothetical protein SESBI_14288 [Sesbania bispinosa]
MSEAEVDWQKRRRERPRKIQSDTTQVSNSDFNMNATSSLLDKEPCEIATIVWHMGLELGGSGFDDADVLIKRLEEMEIRDRAAIGRS